jgi:hypothetical protein
MQILITADLHFNHPRSQALAEDLIQEMNTTGGDVLLLIGDTAIADGDSLEQCLSKFKFNGPKLLVPGNHELWTKGTDSYQLLKEDFPRRVANMGWHWLPDAPFVTTDVAIVGSLGWYDYSFAQTDLGIPQKFYERKIAPGVVEQFAEYADLIPDLDHLSPQTRQIAARWNDGIHVKLGRSDQEFLNELLQQLAHQLDALKNHPRIIAAIHCLPFAQLLPPRHSAQWDFAKAYLGSKKIGQLLLQYPNIQNLYCGHSHFPAQAQIQHIQAINIGSGYRSKRFVKLEV